MAAATVPEYKTSSPRFAPSLTPETTDIVFGIKETRDRQVNAVRRRARHKIDPGLNLGDAQRHIERQRVAGAGCDCVPAP